MGGVAVQQTGKGHRITSATARQIGKKGGRPRGSKNKPKVMATGEFTPDTPAVQ